MTIPKTIAVHIHTNCLPARLAKEKIEVCS